MRIVDSTTRNGCFWLLLTLAGLVRAGEPASPVTAAPPQVRPGAVSGGALAPGGPGGASGIAVPLHVRLGAGARTPEHWPVTTGVPFRDGQLGEEKLNTLRVETDSGQAIPAQFEVRGRYPRSRNVRWLGVSFQLDPNAKAYRLVLGDKPDKPAPDHADAIRIAETQDAWVVTTGPLRAEIPRQGGLLGRVWLKDELLLESIVALDLALQDPRD